MNPGKLNERAAFDAPTGGTDAFGGDTVGWGEQFKRSAEFIYQKGDESVQAARLAGRSIYKVRVRSDSGTRQITTDWRMRDLRRGLPSGVTGDTLPGTRYNVREVDAITDRKWVYLVVEADGS